MINILKYCKFEFKYWFTNWVVSYIPCMALRMFWYRQVLCEIGKDSQIWIGCKFYGDKIDCISIGKRCTLAYGVTLNAGDYIGIGDDVSLASGVVVLTADHDYNDRDMKVRTERVWIQQGCHVLTNAIILKGTRLMSNVVVGAGSIVSGIIPEGSIIMGNPSRIIAQRKLPKYYNYCPPAPEGLDAKAYHDWKNL